MKREGKQRRDSRDWIAFRRDLKSMSDEELLRGLSDVIAQHRQDRLETSTVIDHYVSHGLPMPPELQAVAVELGENLDLPEGE